MSWLDRVLAVPAVGMRLRPWFKTASDYARALEQVLEAMQPEGEATVKAQVAELEFHNDKGLAGKVSSQDVSLFFSYRPELKQKPGSVPHLEYPVQVERYTELLTLVEAQMAAVVRALHPGKRPVAFIGVVADAQLDRKALPPGAERLIAHLGRPWELGLEECRAAVSAIISRQEGSHTRCHHSVVFHPEDEGILNLKLDYQLVFDPMCPMTAEDMIKNITAVRDSAFAYFDRFGKGDLRYGE